MSSNRSRTTPLRPTRQRVAIAAALGSSDDFRSAQEIHERMRARGEKIGLATVYRTLQAMSAGGEIDVLRADSGETVYRRCRSTGHHHHLVCRRCGRTVEVEAPDVERWARQVGERHGFAEVGHTVEVFGTCPDCVGAGGGA